MAHQNQGERKMLHSVAFQGTPYFRWRLTRVGARGRACPGLISVGPFWAKTIPPTLARVIVECVRYVDHGSTIGGGDTGRPLRLFAPNGAEETSPGQARPRAPPWDWIK